MFGNWATGRLVMVTAPIDDRKNCNHHRHDGRLMKNLDIWLISPSSRRRLRHMGLGLTCAPGRTFCTPSATRVHRVSARFR